MDYCLYNAIKTPDGTILWCQSGNGHYQSHVDSVTGETYINDGKDYSVRRSVNIVPYEDLSVWTSSPFEKIREVKFWGSYGKDGRSPLKIMCLAEMEKDHILAIIATQKQIQGQPIEPLFPQELTYRAEQLKNQFDQILSHNNKNQIKPKL